MTNELGDGSRARPWPSGESVTAELIRVVNWAETPLGSLIEWPESLRTVVDQTLSIPVAAILLWGPEHIQIYNDLWIELHPATHPAAMGQRTHDCFPQLVSEMSPLYARVLRGEGLILEDSLLRVLRRDEETDAWCTAMYTPIRGRSGAVDGILCTLTDTTGKVLAGRAHRGTESALRARKEQQAFLLRLSDAVRIIINPAAIQQTAMQMLGEELGLSRAFYFQVEREDGHWVHVVEQEFRRGPALPAFVGRHSLKGFGSWLFEELAQGKVLAITDVADVPRFTPEEVASYHAIGVTSFINVPLLRDGKYDAGITGHHTEPHIWTDDEIGLLREVGNRTWEAVERARSEEALREGEKKFRALVTASSYSIYTMSPDWKEMRSLEGRGFLSDQTLPEQDWPRAYILAEDLPSVRAAIDEAIQAKKTFQMEHRVLRADGKVGWTHSRAVPLMDEVGEVKEWIGAASDITDRKSAEEHLREQQERQSFLLNLSDALRPLDETRQITAVTCSLLGTWLGASRVYYVTWPPGREYGEVAHDYSAPGLPSREGVYPAATFRSAYDRLLEGTTWVVADAAADTEMGSEERQYHLENRDTAWIDVPLVKRSRVQAALCVVQDTARRWTAGEVTLVEQTAERCWAAVERSNAEFALRESERRLSCELEGTLQLQKISSLLIEEKDEDSLYDAILDVAMVILHADFGSIQMLEVKGKELRLLAWRNFHADSAKYWERVTTENGTTCGLALQHRERIMIGDVRTGEAALDRETLEHYERCGILALQSTPLTTRDGHIIGMLSTHWREPHVPDESEIRLLDILVRQTSDFFERRSAQKALLESEARFRLFVENVREYALMQTDLEGIVTSWNPGAERLFGYFSAEIVGRPFVTMLPEENRHEGIIAREMSQLSEGKKNVATHTMQRKDGSRFYAEWVTEPVFDDAGKLRGTAKIMRDETERQAAETSVRSSLADKEELLKEVHHRVKNNLQVITSLLNLQAGSVQDHQALTLFEEARNRVQSIATIHELLYRSVSFESISLRTYAAELLPGLIQFYGMQTQVRAEILGDEQTVELERAVPLGLLLNELVSNALKHAFPDKRAGVITIDIGCRNEDIVLRISDNGIGLPEAFAPQNSNSLGLKLVSIFMRQLRGEMRVIAGEGTTFEARFPKRDDRKGELDGGTLDQPEAQAPLGMRQPAP